MVDAPKRYPFHSQGYLPGLPCPAIPSIRFGQYVRCITSLRPVP
jgi:hypothetical protein